MYKRRYEVSISFGTTVANAAPGAGVLVNVLVTDTHALPVTGLTQDQFIVAVWQQSAGTKGVPIVSVVDSTTDPDLPPGVYSVLTNFSTAARGSTPICVTVVNTTKGKSRTVLGVGVGTFVNVGN